MSDGPILVISGTSRPNANTRRVADVVVGHYARLGVAAELYCLTEMPLEAFAPQAYAVKPPAIVAVQQRVVAARGLHLVVPEYNGSFPGVLKHLVDLLKFPDSFEAKPVAFVGLASGAHGALRAVEQLQMVFAYRNAHLFPQRVFIPSVGQALDAAGRLVDAELDARLGRQAGGFARFVEQLRAR